MAAFLQDSSLLEETNNNLIINFSHFYDQPENLQEITAKICVHGNSSCCVDQYCTITNNDHHQLSDAAAAHVVTNKTSTITTDSSSIIDKVDESGDQVSQMVAPVDKTRKNKRGCSMNSAQSKNVREVKGKKQKKGNDIMKAVEDKKDDEKACEEAPTGYIHVRARRGQATDSHSLAERVRREKISERMKILQALVPGCDKVTGKALMLDEIINYVQSLQHQVEFLSMKLASVNPMLYDFGVDLDAVMVRNEQRLNALTSPPPPPPPQPSIIQPCNPTQSSVTSDPNNVLPTPNNYTIHDTSPSLLFQQGYFPNTLPQVDNGQVWWDIDEQRQKLINQFVFTNNLPLM